MFRRSFQKSFLKSFPFVCFPVLMILLSTAAWGQIGNTGIDDDPASGMRQGNNTIVGQVGFPAGYKTRRLTVRLSSVRVGEFSTMTDDNGVFTFRRLREGSYFVRIEAGKDFLPAQETVDFYDNRGRTLNVQFELRLRPTPNTKPGVINAAFVGVPQKALDLYREAMSLVSRGESRKAIEQLKSAIEIHPRFIIALNELSALYVNLNELKNAEAVLAAALKHDPNNATLHLNYGYVFLLMARFADADREFSRAQQLNEKSAITRLYRGRVLIRLQKLDEAETELLAAIRLGGESMVLAHRYLGELYSQRREPKKAIESLETYLKLKPDVKDADELKKIIAQLQQEVGEKKD